MVALLLPPSRSPSLRPSSVSLPAARRTWRGDRFGLLQTDVVSDGAATLTASAAKERASETCFHSAVKASSHSHRSSAQVCPALGFLDECDEAFALISKAFDAHEPKRGEFLRHLPRGNLCVRSVEVDARTNAGWRKIRRSFFEVEDHFVKKCVCFLLLDECSPEMKE